MADSLISLPIGLKEIGRTGLPSRCRLDSEHVALAIYAAQSFLHAQTVSHGAHQEIAPEPGAASDTGRGC